MNEPKWLTAAEIVEINKAVTAATKEPHGVRDMGLVESASDRARNLYGYSGETDTFQLAASYAEGISRNHAFFQGNKRTAFIAADGFLFKNGFELQARQDDGYVAVMENLAQGKASREDLASYLRDNARSLLPEKQTEREQSQPATKDWSVREPDAASSEKNWSAPATPDPVAPAERSGPSRRRD